MKSSGVKSLINNCPQFRPMWHQEMVDAIDVSFLALLGRRVLEPKMGSSRQSSARTEKLSPGLHLSLVGGMNKSRYIHSGPNP